MWHLCSNPGFEADGFECPVICTPEELLGE